jgi:hypothetical protein
VDQHRDRYGMSKARFRALFMLIPAVVCSIVPSIIFGLLADQWGTNLVWGSYFGIGWCLSAFWSGNIDHDGFSTIIGLLWGWGAMIPLYFAAGWFWERLTSKGRRVAVGALAASALLIVPAKTMMRLDQLGVHLPDYMTHLATSY